MSNTIAIDFNDIKTKAIEDLKSGKSLVGKDGALTPLIKEIIEASLEGEMEAHIDESVGNRRNGKSRKTVKSDVGSFDLETPRDRNGTFEPQLVKKRQTVLNEALDEKILALFCLGMSYEDIRKHLADMYGVEISKAKISAVTDKLLPVITEWRSRPLESIYPVIFLDAMFFKTREDNKVVQKAIYMVLGINQQGHKDGRVESWRG